VVLKCARVSSAVLYPEETQGSDSTIVRRSTPPLTAVRRAASVDAPVAGRHGADRRAQAVRATAEGARGTWQGSLRDALVCVRAWENTEPREAWAARMARQARRGWPEIVLLHPCLNA
jgi:hypothetical protein